VELYLHFPNTLSWRGAQLKHRDNFTFNPVWNGIPAIHPIGIFSLVELSRLQTVVIYKKIKQPFCGSTIT
jgi:hypothetical protein